MNRKDLAIFIERYDEESEAGFDQDPIDLASASRSIPRDEINKLMKEFQAKGGKVTKLGITESSGVLTTDFNPWYR